MSFKRLHTNNKKKRETVLDLIFTNGIELKYTSHNLYIFDKINNNRNYLIDNANCNYILFTESKILFDIFKTNNFNCKN